MFTAWIDATRRGEFDHPATLAPATTPATPVDGLPDFRSMAPTRVLDTRIGLGAPKAPVGPGRSITVQLAGVSGIPTSGVAAVVLNLTAVTPTTESYLTVYPTGTTRPTASTVNVTPGSIVANEVIATLGTNGRINIYNAAGTTQVLADVTGWYATGSYYHPLTPTRILDTRTGLGAAAHPVGQGQTITVAVTGHGGVPAAGVSAVAINLTATAPTTTTYITEYPAGQTRPVASNLNLVAGQTTAVLVLAKLGANGAINLFNYGGHTYLIADITGWFTPNIQFTPITPTRVMDTRLHVPGALAPGESRAISIAGKVSIHTDVAIVSLTAVAPTGAGYLSVRTVVDPPVRASVLNFKGGQTVANLAFTQVTTSQQFLITNHSSGSVQILVDLTGFLVELPRFTSPATAPAATVAAPYTYTVSAAGGIPPYSWQFTITPPPGLHLAPVGPESVAITGVPTTPGTYTFIVRVMDSKFTVADQTITLVVRPFVAGAVWSWGLGESGELGAVTDETFGVPGRINGLSDITAVAASNVAGYALRSDGTVWAWGAAGLGNGTAGRSDTPVQVSGLTGITAIAGGGQSGYALRSDGTVWAWGRNDIGQLGDGTTTDRLVPVQASGLTDITAIAANDDAGYALRADGTVWAWGANVVGELGDGTTTTRLVPVHVSGLTGITAIAGKDASGYAVGADGTVWAWGRNLNGELGDGTTTNRLTPVQVSGLTGITTVAGGWGFALALSSDGTVWAWGGNSSGQLGDRTRTDRLTPVQVHGLTGVTMIAAGFGVSYALTSDGAVWAWGDGGNGNLGTGNTTFSTTPIRIAGVPRAKAIAAGTTAVYALGTP